MKSLIHFVVFLSMTVSAQPITKKVLIEGKGQPIVLLAGGTGDMSVYKIVSGDLSKNYMVIRMEHLSVQHAEDHLAFPPDYSVRTESEAVKNTLDSLQIHDPVILLGHSYGGLMALDFALQHPTAVRALILLEPPVFGIADAHKEILPDMEKMKAITRQLTPQADITEDLVEQFRCALMHCDSISIRQHPQWSLWVQQKDRLRGLSAVPAYQVDLVRLKQFSAPVLIITGTETVAFHKKIDQLLTQTFPHATACDVHSGHAIPATVPDELIRCVRSFLKQ